MKCPKCGYNSFEFLDTCKKCGAELGNFKKTHRINPVVLTPTAGPSIAAAPPVAVPESVTAAGMNTDAVFSWDAAEDATGESSAYSGFDLGFEDTGEKSAVQDTELTGFTFSDEPETTAGETAEAPETTSDAFTFDEPAEEKPAETGWDIQFDDDGSSMEKYERMIDPEGMAEKVSGESETDNDFFGTTDFSFEPEESGENAESVKEASAPSTTDGKPKPNLEDFDKEFELIFSDSDQASSEDKKNS